MRRNNYFLGLPGLVLAIAILHPIGAQALGYLLILLFAFCLYMTAYSLFAIGYMWIAGQRVASDVRRYLYYLVTNSTPLLILFVEAQLGVWR